MDGVVITLLVGISTIACTLAQYLDSNLCSSAKGTIGRRMLGRKVDGGNSASIDEIYYYIFNQLFGEKQFSWFCLRRTLKFSIFIVFLGLLIVELYHVGFYAYFDFFTSEPRLAIQYLWNNIGANFFLVIIVNGLADFLSVWESRWIFKRVSKSGSIGGFVYMILGFLISIFTLLICAAVSIVIVSVLFQGEHGSALVMDYKVIPEKYIHDKKPIADYVTMIPFVISSCFSMVVVLMVIFLVWTKSKLASIGRGKDIVFESLNIGDAPFQLISVFFVTLLWLVFFAYSLF